jgi:Zn2+/Cd2+-exporting ATPase
MAVKTVEILLDAPQKSACEPCIRQFLRTTEGIKTIDVDRRGTCLIVTYDDTFLPLPRVQNVIADAHSDALEQAQHDTLLLSGLDCADCANTLERGVRRLAGVIHVNANFATSKMAVGYQAGTLKRVQIEQLIHELGYGVVNGSTGGLTVLSPVKSGCGSSCACGEEQHEHHHGSDHHHEAATPETLQATNPNSPFVWLSAFWERYNRWLPTALAALIWTLAFALELFHATNLLVNALYGVAIVVGGYRIARSGYFALVRGRMLGIDLLMTIAVVGAALIGQWSEGAAVVVLFSLGEMLEGVTMDKMRHSIRGLIDLSPREATIKTETGEQRVVVDQLQPGAIMLVKPGERVAADGKIVLGSTTINQAPITGESLPVEKAVGDDVFAGTLNEHGYIEVEVTKRAEETMIAKIIALVQEAQGSRAPSQRFVDQFARYYTPAIIVIAVLVALVPPLVTGGAVLPWLYKALVLLVIACPCALVISTPVSIVAAIGCASRSGILIKGGAYLEAMSKVKAIAFDKTGTITRGHPLVTDILPLDGRTENELLVQFAAIESRSEHPLAKAILDSARERHLSWPEPVDFLALPGRGAQATVEGTPVTVGKPHFFAQEMSGEIQAQVERLQLEGKTVLLARQSGTIHGLIAVADEMRPDASQAIKALKACGITTLIMLTGDNEKTAQVVARNLDLDEVRANLLPDQKTQAMRELVASHPAVAMIGDGINDAPALASATVGIAMGVAGSDTALETADIALMKDDLSKLPYLIRLSRATLRTIQTNVTFSLLVKAAFLTLTLLGIANLWLAILADTGAALLVIANGMLLLHFRDK